MRLLPLPLIALTGLSLSPLTAQDCGGEEPTSPTRIQVGAEVVSILPTVGGSTTYFDAIRTAPPLAAAPGDPGDDPGVFVEQWDVGTIAIGNGARYSHWVHDDIRASAIAFRDTQLPGRNTVVLVSVDVYMLFRQDIQVMIDKVQRLMTPVDFETLEIVVSATHNHMGPDTSGLSGFMNEEYYDYMADRVAEAIVGAVEKLEPAQLRMASSRYQFGLADNYAPYITDPTLNTLQAVADDDPNRVVATMVQWQNHPEDTLGFGEQVLATPEQAAYLKSIGECISNDDGATCHVEGQFISAGFPGITAREIMAETGAPAVYFTGPVGGLLAPIHAYVWETEGPLGKPAGDGTFIPEGAALVPKNFHKQYVNGHELAKRVLADLATAEDVIDPALSVAKTTFYGKLSNLLFRTGMSLSTTRKPLVIGYEKRELYLCSGEAPFTDDECVSDGYRSENDPLLRVPVRVGEYGKTEAFWIRLGPLSLLTAPAEVFSETVEGLPSDFVADPRGVYLPTATDKTNNVAPAAYNTAGYVRQMMGGRYRWFIGLAMDELGYMVPRANFRVFCVADTAAVGGAEGNCAALYEAGIMEFRDADGGDHSISGQRCHDLAADPTLLTQAPYTNHPDGALWAERTCYYGQSFGDVDGHYPESLSASWDMEHEYVEAVRGLIGWTEPLAEVNPAFIGYNMRD